MERLGLLALVFILLAGCGVKAPVTATPAMMYNFPVPHTVLYQLSTGVYPNVQFCGYDLRDLYKGYRGVSVTAKGRVVYAFTLIHESKHPDTWAVLIPDPSGNRWPHLYRFDMDGNGSAELNYRDMKRDGTCKHLEQYDGREENT